MKKAGILFVVMLLSGLCSTLDSALCAGSSMGAIDIYREYINRKATHNQILKEVTDLYRKDTYQVIIRHLKFCVIFGIYVIFNEREVVLFTLEQHNSYGIRHKNHICNRLQF